MCGIIACINGNGEVCLCVTVVLNGVNKLMNRGNDNYGLGGVDQDGKLICHKVSNPLKKMPREVLDFCLEDFTQSIILMGHSRWPTTGSSDVKNAHPHICYRQELMMVHNGCVDNCYELRTWLKSKVSNIVFKSETDTEIIVDLLSYHCFEKNLDLDESLKIVTKMIRGCYACVLMQRGHRDKLYAFRSGCPLIIGYKQDMSLACLASELAAFPSEIEQYDDLQEGVLYKITKSNTDKDTSLKTSPITMALKRLQQSQIVPDSPFPYPHWMLKEIREQPDCLSKIIHKRLPDSKKTYFPELERFSQEFFDAEHVILFGCGSSYYAGLHSKHFLQQTGIFNTVQCLDASDFNTIDIARKGKTVAILLSQSGETRDLIRVFGILNVSKIMTIAVVNVKDSTLARISTVSLLLEADPEICVASTKSYTCQILMIKFLSMWCLEKSPTLTPRLRQTKNVGSFGSVLKDQIDKIFETTCLEKLQSWANTLSRLDHVFILARQNSYSLAKETCLKLVEIGYIHAEPYSIGALKHGVYSLVEPSMPIIFILPREDTNEIVNNTLSELKARGAVVWVVTDTDSQFADIDDVVVVPHNAELYGVLHIVVFQLIAYYIAVNKGHSPDYPRNLAKCVTVD